MIRSQKGFALMMSLAIAILVGLMIPALLNVAISRSQMSFVTTNGIRAQYLAEAAIQFAIWQLRNNVATSPVTCPGALCPSQAEAAIFQTAAGWQTTITKTGPDAGGGWTINVVVNYPDT